MQEIWFKNKADALDINLLKAIAIEKKFTQGEYVAIATRSFTVVPNTKDNRGGYFVTVNDVMTSDDPVSPPRGFWRRLFGG